MALFDEADPFGRAPKAPPVHEIGQALDALSAHELAERIAMLLERRKLRPPPPPSDEEIDAANAKAKAELVARFELLVAAAEAEAAAGAPPA